MSEKKNGVALVLFILAIWISLSEFLRREILISKLFALLFLIVALYLFLAIARDLFRKKD